MPNCNSIVEAEVMFEYGFDIEQIDELHCEGTIIKLAKCLNCQKPILLSENFTEIEGHYYPQSNIQ